MTEKWHLLELFSRASFYTGLCYMQAGDIRGAKSMLLHCLIFCEAFRMRKRFHLAFKLFSRISHFNLIIILMYYCWLRKPVKVIKLNQEIDKKKWRNGQKNVSLLHWSLENSMVHLCCSWFAGQCGHLINCDMFITFSRFMNSCPIILNTVNSVFRAIAWIVCWSGCYRKNLGVMLYWK